MQIHSEIDMTNPITYFEAYMFAMTKKHIDRHTSFDDFEIGIINNGELQLFLPPDTKDVSFRKKVLTLFNGALTANGVSYTRDAKRLPNMITYFEGNDRDAWYKEYKDWVEAAVKFSERYHRIVGFCVHPYQLAKDMEHMSAPHVHVIYVRNKGEADLLERFLYQYLGITQ